MRKHRRGSSPDHPSFPPSDEAAWRGRVERELAGADFERTLVTKTPWGGFVQPVYGRTALEDALHARRDEDPAGFPGVPPYLRGGHPALHGSRPWNLCPRFDHPRLEALHAAILADLEGGADAVWLQLDLAGRLGRAAGSGEAHPPREPGATDLAATTSIATDGIPLQTTADFELALAAIHPEMIAFTLDAGANALPAAAVLLAFLRERGVDFHEQELDFFADPCGALARDGALPASIETLEAEAAALAAYCRSHLPCARALAVSTLPWHDAGAHAAQELGLALAGGVRHLRVLEDAGWDPAEAAGQITFVLAPGRDFFEGMARLRALRALWARVLEHCGVDDPAPARIHAVTSRRELSRRDPWVNMLRVTTQVFAAVAGGAEVITAAPFDEPLGQPEALGRRVARNTQIILAEESRLGQVLDPAGGSYYVETLTAQLAEASWDFFRKVEAEGGLPAALTSGWVRAAIDKSWGVRRRDLARRREPVTGVSEFANVAETPLTREPFEEQGRAEAQARARDAAGAPAPPLPVERDARLVEALVGGAARGASIATLAGALHRDAPAELPEPFPVRRDAALFETLRDAADSLPERPAVHLVTLGPLAEHKPRSAFAENFFTAGGFAVTQGAAGETGPGDAAITPPIACLCGADERYIAEVESTARALKTVGVRTVLLAGRPGNHEEAWRAAGVDEFIFLGCDVHAVLRDLLAASGANVEEVQ